MPAILKNTIFRIHQTPPAETRSLFLRLRKQLLTEFVDTAFDCV
jgi:hypothetical protein